MICMYGTFNSCSSPMSQCAACPHKSYGPQKPKKAQPKSPKKPSKKTSSGGSSIGGGIVGLIIGGVVLAGAFQAFNGGGEGRRFQPATAPQATSVRQTKSELARRQLDYSGFQIAYIGGWKAGAPHGWGKLAFNGDAHIKGNWIGASTQLGQLGKSFRVSHGICDFGNGQEVSFTGPLNVPAPGNLTGYGVVADSMVFMRQICTQVHKLR